MSKIEILENKLKKHPKYYLSKKQLIKSNNMENLIKKYSLRQRYSPAKFHYQYKNPK
ncbi:MAG: hypothetical protein KKF48_05345 [Nanoarchaeota archaeon]|nr:hypothetical protein [Nanoarchaeota archaeon]MBU1028444.1 hypothetical protein [Nanoarchaeota archaeon]